jgi:hypothetical protein
LICLKQLACPFGKVCKSCLSVRACTAALATVFALFGDFFRLGVLWKADDAEYTIFIGLTLSLFFFEIIALSVAKKPYFLTFFFWLDLIALLSLIPDIPIIADVFSDFEDSLSIVLAGRATRVSSKAGKIARTVRAIRVIRILKLDQLCGKPVNIRKEKKKEKAAAFSNDIQGTGIGKKLATRMTMIVIAMVLFCILAFSYLLPKYDTIDYASYYMLNQLDAYAHGAIPVNAAYFTAQVANYENTYGANLLYFFINGTLRVNDVDRMALLRGSEIREYKVAGRSFATFDIRSNTTLVALEGVGLTLFVLVLLVLSAWSFARDADLRVIKPIERMIRFVTNLASNPLAKIKIRKEHEDVELQVLENTLLKLAGLLQVGFGDAGSEIISKNMGTKGLDVLVPGRKIFAIFGFAEIRDFSIYTEALQETTSIFANHIARIVHEGTHRMYGNANKNMGNAFLNVWKFMDDNRDPLRQYNRRRNKILGSRRHKTRKHLTPAPTLDVNGNLASSSTAATEGPGSTRSQTDVTSGAGRRRGISPPRVLPGSVPTAAKNVDSDQISYQHLTVTKPEKEISTARRALTHTKKPSVMLSPPRKISMLTLKPHMLWQMMMADQALISYCQVALQVRKHQILERWRHDDRLIKKFKGKPLMEMGFGLHVGWAIEGAIGSQHKIDASYLSPNVNLTARLEAASKQYGVPVLMSGEFRSLLQPGIRHLCRHLDRVTVKGSALPIDIYTLDIAGQSHHNEAFDFDQQEMAVNLTKHATKIVHRHVQDEQKDGVISRISTLTQGVFVHTYIHEFLGNI